VPKHGLFQDERYLQFCSVCARVNSEGKNDGGTSVENLAIIEIEREPCNIPLRQKRIYISKTKVIDDQMIINEMIRDEQVRYSDWQTSNVCFKVMTEVENKSA